MIRLLQALRRDRSGVTLVEFALVAPVVCVGMIGAYDIGHSLYMRAAIEGELQKAARDTSLESGIGRSDTLDDKVRAQVLSLVDKADIRITKRSYRTFSEAAEAKAEPFTDTNGNKMCDDGEPFEDRNRNGVRDLDGGDDYNRSGAEDAIVYNVQVSYARLFPMSGLLGWSRNITMEAETVLANQPYGEQAPATKPAIGHCK